MNSKERAGGSWVSPWTKLHYVQAQLAGIDYTLKVSLGWNGDALLTADENELLIAVADCRRILERIM